MRNPIRHGCGEAFNSFSNLSQNCSGSTLASTSSCIRLRTLLSTGFGSLLDNSSKLAKNLRHFSLVFSCWAFCWALKRNTYYKFILVSIWYVNVHYLLRLSYCLSWCCLCTSNRNIALKLYSVIQFYTHLQISL